MFVCKVMNIGFKNTVPKYFIILEFVEMIASLLALLLKAF